MLVKELPIYPMQLVRIWKFKYFEEIQDTDVEFLTDVVPMRKAIAKYGNEAVEGIEAEYNAETRQCHLEIELKEDR